MSNLRSEMIVTTALIFLIFDCCNTLLLLLNPHIFTFVAGATLCWTILIVQV